ncbi:MAG: hypothetical protein ACK53L_33420, partial [Pirellulaceae bacterium]
ESSAWSTAVQAFSRERAANLILGSTASPPALRVVLAGSANLDGNRLLLSAASQGGIGAKLGTS